MGPRDWVALAKTLHVSRDAYDAFLIVHGEAAQGAVPQC